MRYTAREIADRLGGTVHGDSGLKISGICSPDQVQPGSVVFVRDRRTLRDIPGDPTLCIVSPFRPDNSPATVISIPADHRDQAFIDLLVMFDDSVVPEGICPSAEVSPDVRTGPDVCIGPRAVIGPGVSIGAGTRIGAGVIVGRGCVLGSGCTVHPGAVLYPGCTLGSQVIIHSGAVIGSDGFGYANVEGELRKVPQIGGVLLEDRVEVGANTTIDCATIGQTIIGKGTKIDNQVQIGHNVVIGKNVVVCALCGISGSVKIGNNVVLAGAVGLADHIVIEDDVFIGPQAGVMEKLVKKGSKLLGTPAADYKAQMTFFAMRHKIKAMYDDLKRIKEKLGL